MADQKFQIDKYKEVNHAHEADQDEARWGERLAKMAKVNPKRESPDV